MIIQTQIVRFVLGLYTPLLGGGYAKRWRGGKTFATTYPPNSRIDVYYPYPTPLSPKAKCLPIREALLNFLIFSARKFLGITPLRESRQPIQPDHQQEFRVLLSLYLLRDPEYGHTLLLVFLFPDEVV